MNQGLDYTLSEKKYSKIVPFGVLRLVAGATLYIAFQASQFCNSTFKSTIMYLSWSKCSFKQNMSHQAILKKNKCPTFSHIFLTDVQRPVSSTVFWPLELRSYWTIPDTSSTNAGNSMHFMSDFQASVILSTRTVAPTWADVESWRGIIWIFILVQVSPRGKTTFSKLLKVHPPIRIEIFWCALTGKKPVKRNPHEVPCLMVWRHFGRVDTRYPCDPRSSNPLTNGQLTFAVF